MTADEGGIAEAHPVEVEVKLRADSAALEAALASPAFRPSKARPRVLRSVYFDTADHDLHRAGIVLRVRSDSGKPSLMTVKFDVEQGRALFHRHEVEVPCSGPAPDLALFGKKMARRLTRLMRGAALEGKFETQVTRRIREAVHGASLIEAAFDEGRIVLPDGREQQLSELELELKSGSAGDLFALARQLASEHPLRLDVTSKSEKGFALLRAAEAVPVKAGRLELAPKAMLAEVVQAVLANTIMHFTANWPALMEGDDAESIHQLRVALRRMKTGFRMFERMWPGGEAGELRRECGRLGSALGRARDLDAFLSLVSDDALRSAAGRGLAILEREARRRRAQAIGEARELIASQEATDFVLRAEGFAVSCAAPGEARKEAAESLRWLHKRVMRRGRKLAARTSGERHRLRIALKDLRYGVEFLSGVTGHEARAGRLARAAARLQEILGMSNDAASASLLAQELASGLDQEAAAAAGFVSGWLARGAAAESDELELAWKAFRKCRPCWDA